GPLRVGDPRRAADARDFVRRIDHLAAVGGSRPYRPVDVLDRYVRDPVRRLAVALGRGVAADHRVAGIDHLVGLVAHRERLDLPPEHVAVEHLCPLGVLGNQLEPHEFSWKRLAIGHGVFSLRPNVERAPPGSTPRQRARNPSWRAGPIASWSRRRTGPTPT